MSSSRDELWEKLKGNYVLQSFFGYILPTLKIGEIHYAGTTDLTNFLSKIKNETRWLEQEISKGRKTFRR